jgi:hypothetical protein
VTNEDFAQLEMVGRHLRGFERVGLLSPAPRRQRRPWWHPHPRSEFKVFPQGIPLRRRRWDLNVPGREEFELIVGSSVLMYSPQPDRWLRHILAACEYFLMIDLVRRRRREGSELDLDGDRMRFAIGDARPRVDTYFDLTTLGDRLLGFRTYHGGANAHDDRPVHLIALFRGDLAVHGEDHDNGIRAAVEELGRDTFFVEAS